MDYQTQLAEIQQADAENIAKVEALRGAIGKIEGGAIDVDIENATLADARTHNKSVDANIVSMVVEMDELIGSFMGDFQKLKSKTPMEKFIGIFSKDASDKKRIARIASADVGEKLQDLIQQTQGAVDHLEGFQEKLVARQGEVSALLSKAMVDVEAVVAERDDTRTAMDAANQRREELEAAIANETKARARTKLENELAKVNIELNELDTRINEQTAREQSYATTIKQGKVYVTSLEEQISANRTVVAKLKADIEARSVLYETYAQAIESAENLEIAHRLNETGEKVDLMASTGMAAIGAASTRQTIEMLERFDSVHAANSDVGRRQAAATEEFRKRFMDVDAKMTA